MQHRRNHVREVVHRIEHQFVGLVVIAQRCGAHHLSDEEVVRVAGKVVDEVEAKQVAGVAADFVHAAATDLPAHGRTGGEIIPAEDESGVEDRLDGQCIVSEPQKGQADAHDSRQDAGQEDAEGHFLEFLPPQKQCVGNDVERGEKKLHRQQDPHRKKFRFAVEERHGIGEESESGGEDEAETEGEGEDAADVFPGEFLVLDDAGSEAHIGQEGEEGGENEGDGHDAEVLRREDVCQDGVEKHPQQERGVACRGVDIGRLFDGCGGHASAVHQVKEDIHGTDALL